MTTRPAFPVLAGVFLIALASLLFEVSLTRIFSVTLWYHFGFLVIALAMLGATAAAVGCFVFRQRLAGPTHDVYLGAFALLFAAAAPLAILYHLSVPFDQYTIGGEKFWLFLGFQLFSLFLVFFAAGMVISLALMVHARHFNKVYFFDLVGAGLGTVLLLLLLGPLSPLALTFLVAASGAAAAHLFWQHRVGPIAKHGLQVLVAASLVLLCVNDRFGPLTIRRVKTFRGDRVQEVEPRKVLEKWSAVGRGGLFPPRTVSPGREMMRITLDAAAPANMHKFDGDLSKLKYLAGDFRQAAHHLKRNANVLIIGSAGGRDVRAALAFDQRQITAVEINPITSQLVTQDFADYIGQIFQHPRVTFHNAEGRIFLANSGEMYDLIQISMIDSWGGASAGAYVFNESNLYTKQAIADYLSHLAPGGIVSITRYYSFDEALRLVNIMLEHLEDQGVGDPHQRLAVVLEQGRKNRANVLLKNGTYTAEEIGRLTEGVSSGGHAMLYAPYGDEAAFVQTDYARLFRSLIEPTRYGRADRQEIVAAYPRDISAVTDNRPFFFFLSRFGDVFNTQVHDHAARKMALPILYGTLLFLAAACLVTVLLPLWFSRRCDIREAPFRWRSLTYFGCLGSGFMLVELSLIHKFTVVLGVPAYSFVTVVTTLLLAGGLGSLFSGAAAVRGKRTALYAALASTAAYGAALGVAALGGQLSTLRLLPDVMRIACVAGVIAPLGFAMGMCLPMGMAIVRRAHEGFVPWGWGVNGVCSVFGCALTLVLALNFGLAVCLFAAAACYLVALGCMASIRPTGHEPRLLSAGSTTCTRGLPSSSTTCRSAGRLENVCS